MRMLLVGLVLASISIPATAAINPPKPSNEIAVQDNSGGVTAPAAKPQPITEKLVCRRIPSSYSHRSEKICLTKKQWEEVDDYTG